MSPARRWGSRASMLLLLLGVHSAAAQSLPPAEPPLPMVETLDAEELPDAGNRAARSSTKKAGPDDTAEDIWRATCAMCHRKDGTGKTWMGEKAARNFTDRTWQAKVSDDDIKAAILEGRRGTRMKSFDKKMSDAQLEEMVRYVRAFGGASAPSR
jgi:mono/diheme cytochrome c family protein